MYPISTSIPLLPIPPKQVIKLECPTSHEQFNQELKSRTEKEIRRGFMDAYGSFQPYTEYPTNQIENILKKPTELRLQELIEMQTSSKTKMEAVQNIISVLFHEIVILPTLNNIVRQDLRIDAMRERNLKGKANDSQDNIVFKINLNLLSTETLAFYFRFINKIRDKSKLSKELIQFFINHKDEINNDFKGFIADLIIFYELSKYTQRDMTPEQQKVMKNFDFTMQSHSDLKKLFEFVCPISSFILNRFNGSKRENLKYYIENKSMPKTTTLTFNELDVYRPLFQLWLKTKKSQLDLFKAAFAVLNEEKNKQMKNKIQFIRTYFNDPSKFTTEPFESYPTLATKLVTHLERPYVLEGELESLFMSKKPTFEIKEGEEKRSPQEIAPPPKTRKKKNKASKPQSANKEEMQNVLPQTVTNTKTARSVSVVKTKTFPFAYDARVSDWFTKSPKQLLFSSYHQLSKEDRQRQWAYHGFAREVDQFVLSYGVSFLRPHEVTGDIENCYCIPGEIAFTENTRNERGLFTYTINKNNELYHRFFTIASPDKMIACMISKTFDQIDFPKLGATVGDFQDIPVSIPRSEAEVTINSLTDAVTILDTYHRMRITLFKYAE